MIKTPLAIATEPQVVVTRLQTTSTRLQASYKLQATRSENRTPKTS